MAASVAQLQVNVGADIREAEAALKRIDAAVRETASGAKGLGSPFAALGSLMTAPFKLLGSAITAPIRLVGDMTGRVVEMAAGFALGQLGVQGLTGAFQFLEEGMIGYNARLEQSRIAWTTFLGTKEDADAMLMLIQKFAATTPFDYESVEKATRQIVAYGFEVKDALDMTRDFGNASSGLNVGAEGMERMIRALGQMNAKGKVTQNDLNQLNDLGVNMNQVFAVMSQQTGKTVSELRQMQSDGSLAASTFIKAFREWTQTRFGDMMAQQSKTFAGSIETIKDSVMQASAMAFKPLFDRISELAQRIAQFVSSDQFPAWAGNVAAYVEVVLQSIGTLVDAFSEGFRAIFNIVVTVGKMIYEALSWINPFATHSPSLISQVKDGVDYIIAKYGTLSAIEPAIRGAKDAITALNQAAAPGLAGLKAKDDAERDRNLGMLGPGVVESYHAAEGAVKALEDEQSRLNLEIMRQEQVVDAAEKALRSYDDAVERASDAVESSRESLNVIREQMDSLSESAQTARAEITRLSQAPLAGSKAYSDRLFGIDQQIAALQLKMTKLKLAGAPADQIKAIQKEIDKLNLTAEETRLQEKIELDPLRRQIDDLANSKPEMAFGEIVSGITAMQQKERDALAALGPMTEAYKAQEQALRGLERSLKDAQKAREAEQEKVEEQKRSLSEQKEAVGALKGQIDEWKNSMQEATKAANDLWQEANKKDGGAGGGADDLMGGAGNLGPGDLSFLEKAKQQAADFKKNFDEAVKKIKEDWQPKIDGFVKTLQNWGQALQGIAGSLENTRKVLGEFGPIGAISDLLYPGPELDENAQLENEMAQRMGRKQPYQAVRFTNAEALIEQVKKDILAALVPLWETLKPEMVKGGTMLGESIGNAMVDAAVQTFKNRMAQDLSEKLKMPVVEDPKTGEGPTRAISLSEAAKQKTNQEWNDLGKAVVNSFGLGMSQNAPTLDQVIGGIIQTNIIDPVKRILGIASPSTVAIGWGQEIVNGLWDGIAGKGTQLLQDTERWININLIDPIKKVLGIGGEKVTTYGFGETAGQELIDGLASKLQTLTEQATAFGEALMNGIKQGMANIQIPMPRFDIGIEKRNILGQEVDWPKFNLGFDWKSLAELMGIQQLATGGIATKPTLAMIGEAGSEAVVPLGKYNALARQAYGNSIDYDRLGAAVARAMIGMKFEADGQTLGRVVRNEDRRFGRANSALAGANG